MTSATPWQPARRLARNAPAISTTANAGGADQALIAYSAPSTSAERATRGCSRGPCSAADRLGRPAELADEGLAHPLGIQEADLGRNPFDRLAAPLDPRERRFDPKSLDGLGG